MISAVLALALSSTPGGEPINWMHDDWPAAQSSAAKARKLVAVDVWATWCHTCLSMKGYVLNDPALSKVADQHVYLALDSDREVNAKFFETYEVTAWPTFLVIDPKTKKVVARWVGSGSAPDMVRFFSRANAKNIDALTAAKEKAMTGDKAALKKLAKLAAAKKASPDRSRARLAYIETLYRSDKPACSERAAAFAADLSANTAGVDTGALGTYCALSLEDENKNKAHRLSKLRSGLERLHNIKDLDVSADDLSSLRGTLIAIYGALNDKEAATALTLVRLSDLEKNAAAASNAEQRTTFDYHRMKAYLHLGKHKEAVAMLQSSEGEQPADFNHPWRLALVYLDAKEFDLAKAAIDRALARGYGGRRVRLYSTKIDILKAAGELEAARATFKQGVGELEKTPASMVRPFWRRELMDKESLLQPPTS